MVTRHGNPGFNQVTDDGAQRTSAQLEELCAVFIQPEDRIEPLSKNERSSSVCPSELLTNSVSEIVRFLVTG